ncbi:MULTISPECIES: hypothetical protein [unclassified Bacillus (in: firmicutes)]|uniref:hypothetical protein n=1 Tax=unclassified Bacillus (in: firmicutes) TaxID=185979 RepID=UPI0008EA97AA|nr:MULTISPECIES: hypothetical protein [unclassified Bacillus (in: firmicutes)]SFA86795.1 hypothetical protein SAMN02799634_102164 [Bacillus sp. UNCCL13]SFQ83883.1 hypothetical protein SAMN04488577_2284 [Bacillus sp. cl95]
MRVEKGSVIGYQDMSISYVLLKKSEESRKLGIIMPGAGYTVQAPLLHYTTGILLNKSYDVLHINYQYNSQAYDTFTYEDIVEAIQFDVKTVIDKVLSETNYEEYGLVAKSIGTIGLGSELQRPEFREAKAVWMTPLLSRDIVYESMVQSHQSALCLIGDQDPYFIKERFEKVSEKDNIEALLIADVNHSMEYEDDSLKSVEVLKDVMAKMNHYF